MLNDHRGIRAAKKMTKKLTLEDHTMNNHGELPWMS